jgi:hypothetical protein
MFVDFGYWATGPAHLNLHPKRGDREGDRGKDAVLGVGTDESRRVLMGRWISLSTLTSCRFSVNELTSE